MRFNLIAGPSAGKSTTAAYLFYELKKLKASVELVNEYVKAYAYEKRKIEGMDQMYIFGKQMQYEHRFLKYGVRNIITDSPTMLSPFYASLNGDEEMCSILLASNALYDSRHPATYIYLNRGNKPYVSAGRYQTESEARELDIRIRNFVRAFCPKNSFYEFDFEDRESILKLIASLLDDDSKDFIPTNHEQTK